MPQKIEVKYTPIAVTDMDEIFSFITQDNASAADMILERLNDQISRLSEFPNMGSVLSEEDYTLVQSGYRFIVVKPYLVFYRFCDNAIIIYRVLHSRRDYLRELFTRL